MSVKMGWFHVVFISLCLFKGTWPFQWTSDRSGVVNLSSGQDLHLPWSFTLSHGQQVSVIQWYFRGQSEELIAMISSHGVFIPMASFANRVEFVPPAGIVVKNVVPSDSGNYAVEVMSHTGPNSFPDQSLTVVVHVTTPTTTPIPITTTLAPTTTTPLPTTRAPTTTTQLPATTTTVTSTPAPATCSDSFLGCAERNFEMNSTGGVCSDAFFKTLCPRFCQTCCTVQEDSNCTDLASPQVCQMHDICTDPSAKVDCRKTCSFCHGECIDRYEEESGRSCHSLVDGVIVADYTALCKDSLGSRVCAKTCGCKDFKCV